MKHSKDQDPVWDLLENARNTEPAGNFTQNVMREIRLLDPDSGQKASSGWFWSRLALGLGAAALIAVGGFVILNRADEPPQIADSKQIPVSYAEEISIEEFADELEELAYMSQLMDVPDTSLLADEDLAALLF